MTNTSASPESIAFGTPNLVVTDNRGHAARALSYNRRSVGAALKEYIERTTYDALGRSTSRIDPRLFANGSPQPNFVYVSSLSGHVLRTDGVDAGTHWMLRDVDGRPVWMHDGRDTITTLTYDALGRPLSLQETLKGQPIATRDVRIYGEQEPNAQANNLRGQCVRCYDTAGKLSWSGFRLTGQSIDETRQLLANAEIDPDWAGQESTWSSALDKTLYTTKWLHDALGVWHTQTDAKGNVQQSAVDVAGRLASSSLKLATDQRVRTVLSSIDYSAAGQVLSETAGNGAVSSHVYEPQTRRLIGLKVTRPAQANRATVVQDLSYEYDPVGNVVRLSDAAQATSHWRNQKIPAANTYAYDALYQLIIATGREMANYVQQSQTLPPATIPLPSDDSAYANYSRTYTYDPGGNLATIQHRGAASYTQTIVVSDRSNHAMLQNGTSSLTPAGIDSGRWFDAAGNAQFLSPDRKQQLEWTGRNQLRRVPLVSHSQEGSADHETYQYDEDGMRVRKRTTTQAKSVTRTVEAIYLPGLTLRITSSGDGKTMTVVESVQEISSQVGSVHARCLHWETGQPASLVDDMVRYGMGDRHGSIGLELDMQANLISREEYYPYGGTAVWTARSQIEADTKFIRYSGKERDATGLYYYGHRNYQPWVGRWLNADPAGTVDGLNVYRMVHNNPVSLSDSDGLMAGPAVSRTQKQVGGHADAFLSVDESRMAKKTSHIEAGVYRALDEGMQAVVPEFWLSKSALGEIAPDKDVSIDGFINSAKEDQSVIFLRKLGWNIESKRILDLKLGSRTASKRELADQGYRNPRIKKFKHMVLDILAGSRKFFGGEKRPFQLVGYSGRSDLSRLAVQRGSRPIFNEALGSLPEESRYDNLVKIRADVEKIKMALDAAPVTFVGSSVLVVMDEHDATRTQARLIDLAHPIYKDRGTADFDKYKRRNNAGLTEILSTIDTVLRARAA